MKVIFLQDVKGKGKKGDIKEALLVAQRDLELNQLLRVKAAAAPAAVPAQGILDEEEEDFFNV